MTNTVFIGYDSREPIASDVCEWSLKHRTEEPIDVRYLKINELREKNIYKRGDDTLGSTEFTFTRFLIPYLMDYKGWALFCDCDFLWLDDVDKLFAQRDDKYAVMCVHHDYTPKEGVKMDGKQQLLYPRKNWSSMVLWNCGHPSNAQVIPSMVNKETGKYMHRFSWLKDKEIGKISHEWNWLEGWYKEPRDGKPKAVHFTEGGPWFNNCQNVDYADLWLQAAAKTGKKWTKI